MLLKNLHFIEFNVSYNVCSCSRVVKKPLWNFSLYLSAVARAEDEFPAIDDADELDDEEQADKEDMEADDEDTEADDEDTEADEEDMDTDKENEDKETEEDEGIKTQITIIRNIITRYISPIANPTHHTQATLIMKEILGLKLVTQLKKLGQISDSFSRQKHAAKYDNVSTLSLS